jgi:protein-S-isoprenylcysteine O-methyltransferase Ste14
MQVLRDPGLIRAACLFVPVFLAVGASIYRRPGILAGTGGALATAWVLASLPFLNLLAIQCGWWSFRAEGGLWMGAPFDLILGWSLLWGFFPAVAFTEVSLPVLAGLFLILDAVAMPACGPVVQLGPHWFWGDLLFVLVVFIPAQQLARTTFQGRKTGHRALFQMFIFFIFFFVDIPEIILGSASFKQALLFLIHCPIAVQVLFGLAVPGLSAVQEFALRGNGTPLPYDPPKRMVTTGVYSYVANPMQVSTTLLFFGCGIFWKSPLVFSAGIVSFIYASGFASWQEEPQMLERYGKAWESYRRIVPRWLPLFRPRFVPDAASAILYYDAQCGPCRDIAGWIQKRDPVRLMLVPAQNHPRRDLERLTYDPGDGREEEGVAALGRALEHLHLGWAFLSWFVRLPVISSFSQLITDVSGGGPRKVCRIQANLSPPSLKDSL